MVVSNNFDHISYNNFIVVIHTAAKINIIPCQFLIRAGFICSLGFVMWLLAAGTFTFTTTNKREDILLPLIIVSLIILSVFLAVVVILKFFSEAKQDKSKVKKESILTENQKGSLSELNSMLCRSVPISVTGPLVSSKTC